MAEFAQFVALPNGIEPFPAMPGRGFTYDLADLNSQRTVILTFRVSGPNNARLQMTAVQPHNTPHVIDFQLDSTFTKPRSWHHVLQGSLFHDANNELVVDGDAGDGGGFALVSDLVVWYHGKT
jgi:hypothetical protein